MILELTDMAPTGEAIGRLEGLVVFVPYAMAGECVEIEIVHRRRSFARARLIRVIRASPDRVSPPCPYFGTCGGCQWQHIAASTQLKLKSQAVKEQLERIGKLSGVEVLPCLNSGQAYGYRNHTQFVLSSRQKCGYYATGSKTVIEVDRCPILDDSLNELLHAGLGFASSTDQSLKPLPADGGMHKVHEVHLRAGVHTRERMVVREEQSGKTTVVQGHAPLHERVGGFVYAISPSSFFQVNTLVAEMLLAEALASLQLKGGEDILDLYCGVGLLTLPISVQARRVLGVESNPVSAHDAAQNLAGSANAEVITADVSDALSRNDISAHAWSAVVLDPPRAGVAHDALVKLLKLQNSRIVYVSCDPATLARDARLICDSGYTLDRVQPLDMFPQTHHVETVATFNR